MEREIAERFVGKRVAFKRNDNTLTFVGILKEVTDNSILIIFRGNLQYHSLDFIVQMEEAYREGENDE